MINIKSVIHMKRMMITTKLALILNLVASLDEATNAVSQGDIGLQIFLVIKIND